MKTTLQLNKEWIDFRAINELDFGTWLQDSNERVWYICSVDAYLCFEHDITIHTYKELRNWAIEEEFKFSIVEFGDLTIEI